LKTAITKWWVHITAGMRRRLIVSDFSVARTAALIKCYLKDVSATDKLSDARRRSRRHPSGYDLSKDPYMLWTNRRAANSS
jgi:bromodomain adjacent to zinc finger domain protein 1A